MRKIEEQMCDAVVLPKDWRSGNTSVHSTDRGVLVRLFGNLIAQIQYDTQEVWVTDATWQTATTKSRLNALLSHLCHGSSIFQKRGDWFLVVAGSCRCQLMEPGVKYAVPIVHSHDPAPFGANV